MEATDEITVCLTAAEWNQTMAILAEGPYRVVAPLLAKIQKQAMAQDGLNGAAPAIEGDSQRVPN
jgi:hypothetical protein